mmetsp:Transcript_11309/g.26578  ORF Transcript_11309/g.26578 Transcript_11309/m.26578 type:complete len:559 (+) Transcript_11309:224-1900(+)
MRSAGTFRSGRTVIYERNALSGFVGIVFALVFLIGAPLSLIWLEKSQRKLVGAYHDIENRIIDLRGARDAAQRDIQVCGGFPCKTGRFLHIQGAKFQGNVSDPDFGVSLDKSLKLARRTEYCQWRELPMRLCQREVVNSDGTKDIEEYDCPLSAVSYSYLKSWLPYRVNSFIFNQPAAHHNPLRDPYPSKIIPSLDAVLTSDSGELDDMTISLGVDVLQNTVGTSWTPVDWTIGGREPKPLSDFSWLRILRSWITFGPPVAETRFESLASLGPTLDSPAHLENNFVFVGQGGYFFSPTKKDLMQATLRVFYGALEGSLFDFQLGDFMPSCSAGDIRVRYEVLGPHIISVLGELVIKSAVGEWAIESYTSSYKTKLGFVHEGSISAKGMVAANEHEASRRVLLSRLLLIPWAYCTCRLLGALLGLELRAGKGEPLKTTRGVVLCATLGLWGLILGMIRISIWGTESGNSYFQSSVVLVLLATAALGHVKNNAAKVRTTPGIFSAWCMLARAARMPPAWRLQAAGGSTPQHESMESMQAVEESAQDFVRRSSRLAAKKAR